jgi:hypothetical protein
MPQQRIELLVWLCETDNITNYSHNSRQINEYISLKVHARSARSYLSNINCKLFKYNFIKCKMNAVNISGNLPGIIIFISKTGNNMKRIMEGINLLEGYILSTVVFKTIDQACRIQRYKL